MDEIEVYLHTGWIWSDSMQDRLIRHHKHSRINWSCPLSRIERKILTMLFCRTYESIGNIVWSSIRIVMVDYSLDLAKPSVVWGEWAFRIQYMTRFIIKDRMKKFWFNQRWKDTCNWDKSWEIWDSVMEISSVPCIILLLFIMRLCLLSLLFFMAELNCF